MKKNEDVEGEEGERKDKRRHAGRTNGGQQEEEYKRTRKEVRNLKREHVKRTRGQQDTRGAG